jgi:hypothetical protein
VGLQWQPYRFIILTMIALALLAMPDAAAHAQSGGEFSAFADTWVRHGFVLTVGSNGGANASWRTYAWCNRVTAPEPCDVAVDNQIISGGFAQIVFVDVENGAAVGYVMESTDSLLLYPGEVVRLRLMPYGMAALDTDDDTIVLCGSNYGYEAPPELIASFPCGA